MNEIIMYRGNNKTINVTVLDKNTELPYDLTNCTVSLSVKKNLVTNEFYIIKTTNNPSEAKIIDAINGIVEFYLVPEDTNVNELKTNIPYPVYINVLTNELKIYTILYTTLTVQ